LEWWSVTMGDLFWCFSLVTRGLSAWIKRVLYRA
jgi:hypothetical protein